MRDLMAIKNVVKDALTGAFNHIRVRDVKIHEEEDSSGDETLIIDVIFEGELSAKELHMANSMLRLKLSQIPVLAFPVLSFISKSDIENPKRASR